MSPMMWDCACFIAMQTGHVVRACRGRCMLFRAGLLQQFNQMVDASAAHTVGIEMSQQRIEPLVPAQHEALRLAADSKVRPSSNAMWKSSAFLPEPEIFKKSTRLNRWAVAGREAAFGGFCSAPTKMIALNDASSSDRSTFCLFSRSINSSLFVGTRFAMRLTGKGDADQ
jgi:hypothetical protein